MKKLIFLSLSLILCTYSFVNAEWLQGGKVNNSEKYAKTDGAFGAMLIFTDKRDELFRNWLKPSEGVDISEANEVKKDYPLTALIVFSNAAPDSRGMADVTAQYTLLDFLGKVYFQSEELEVWQNKKAPAERDLELSVKYITLNSEAFKKAGFYTVRAVVKDKNANKQVILEKKFNVSADALTR